MIIVKLMGGLGNQMFQYAAGRRLAYVHNTELKLDLGWFSNIEAVNTIRKYALSIFTIEENIAAGEEVRKLRWESRGTRERLVGILKGIVLPFRKRSHIRERSLNFDRNVLKLSDNIYLEGYWQCEKYFKDIEELIRKEFTVKTNFDEVNREVAKTIERSESVSVHIRRGDYVNNPRTSRFHGVCDVGYYRSAIALISEKIKNPSFFLFSDDPAWAKENIRFDVPTSYIDHNDSERAHEDMRLMSLCNHHIIANSSFSWWGAWLSLNPDKIVIAPIKWLNDPSINTDDLIPEDWLRI